MEWKFNVSDISIDKIDFAFIMDFDFLVKNRTYMQEQHKH